MPHPQGVKRDQVFKRQVPEGLLHGPNVGITALNHANVRGFLTGLGTVQQSIIDEGGIVNYLLSETTLNISSSSTDDTQGGIGVGQILVRSLNGNGDFREEEILLDGQTAVPLNISILRALQLTCRASLATGLFNIGDIYLSTGSLTAGVPNDPLQIYAKIPSTQNVTLRAAFTIPRGTTGYLSQTVFTTKSNPAVMFDLEVVSRAPGQLFIPLDKFSLSSSSAIEVMPHDEAGLILEEGTDVEVRGNTSMGIADISATMGIFVVNND